MWTSWWFSVTGTSSSGALCFQKHIYAPIWRTLSGLLPGAGCTAAKSMQEEWHLGALIRTMLEDFKIYFCIIKVILL